ncbi:MAG: sensor histidine kinase KdpD [Lachnospiraceae bacterium]|nr:sensor histidine kinase KdpD [Lachnospiraceae bacterium]
MAKAFGGSFTALYVQTPDSEKMDETDKRRLECHVRLAESFGAAVTTVYGDDVSFQIAEFARISGVTKIVIGRSGMKRRHFWRKPTLTEKLTEIAPNIDIHIIPDSLADTRYREKTGSARNVIPSVWDLLITLYILSAVTVLGILFYDVGFTEVNIITVYYLGVLLISLFTRSRICGIISSLGCVILFRFFFQVSGMSFLAYEEGYPVTMAIMLVVSVVTATLANRLGDHARQSSRSAYRTKILFDTSQLLQKAQNEKEMIHITAVQLMKLLRRDIAVYPELDGKLSEGYPVTVLPETDTTLFFSREEREAAAWAYQNRHRAGATTDTMNHTKFLYLSIRINRKVYGVIGVHINGKPVDAFENSFLLSILGECALAIQNSRNAKEKEQAAVLAKNEQLRANLLRAISHDLRTPLTSISGNASNLLVNWKMMDDETRMQVFTDISDDSQWLISLVENLLSVTRIEEGRMNFNMSVQLMDEVIEEALKHISRKGAAHNITVEYGDELLLARIDARLIMQVIINIVDNAIKYAPAGSDIRIAAKNQDGMVVVSISDNGAGIPDEMKPRVFEMFYTGDNKIADSRRSLGLGLPLCRSIINAHGGELRLTDHVPHGCVFTFTLPAGEVNINE